MQATGNPNSHRTVFNDPSPLHEPKRRKTQETSSPRKLGSSTLSKPKPIDPTKGDAELVSHGSTVADSDDSLNLGAETRSKPRIAGDGSATRRLKADHGGGESSKVVNSDTETEPIDEFPSQPKTGGKVRGIVENIERKSTKPHPPKLQLVSNNPLNLLLANNKPKVRLFTEGEGRFADACIFRQSPAPPPRYLHMDKKARGNLYLAYPCWIGCAAQNASRNHASTT